MKKTYTIVHVDTDQGVRAWFPDFPDLIIPGDRLADTLFYASFGLQEHIDKLRQAGAPIPEPTTPDLWAIHKQYPEALIGFANFDDENSAMQVIRRAYSKDSAN